MVSINEAALYFGIYFVLHILYNLVFSAKQDVAALRRKMCIATWDAQSDPMIYAKLKVDVTDSLKYLKRLSEETGVKTTITALVGSAFGQALRGAPRLNGSIALDQFWPSKTVDISFLTMLNKGKNVGAVKVENVDTLSLSDLGAKLSAKAERIRGGKDEDFNKNLQLMHILPTWALRWVAFLVGFLASGLGISAPFLGVRARPFGSAMVTSVGMFGVEEAFVPATPFARLAFTILVGTAKDEAVVVDGNVVIRKICCICATVDHRFVDGFEGAQLMKQTREFIEHPERLAERIEANRNEH